MIISSAKTGMISLYKTTKYCYYFHKLLFTLFLVKIYPRRFLLDILQSDVQNAGCIVIKLVQWLHTRNDIFKDKSSINNSHFHHSPSQILEIFNGIYEHCKIHDMEYTRQVFADEFSENFDDVIELDSDYDVRSGSVAQVYKGRFKKSISKISVNDRYSPDYGDIAIKVVHPDIQYQIIFPYIYYCAYHFLSRLRITSGSPFNIYSFFDTYIKQIDMRREADNMRYFYNEYRDNPLFIIPEPILWSRNILIMKYHDGDTIDDVEDTMSIYNKSNILIYMTLFVKSTIFTESLYHGDLHNGNWKIVKTNSNSNSNTNIPYRIIIYDFGYCIESNAKDRHDFNNLFCSLDFNNISTFSSTLYDYIERAPHPITRQEFIDKSVNMMKDNRTCLFDNDVFIVTVNYFIREKFVLSSKILDVLISIFLIEKLLKKYLYFPELERQQKNQTKDQTKNPESIETIYNISHFNHLNKISQNYLTICETYNCFHKLQANLKNYMREIHTILDKDIDNNFKKYKHSQKGNNNNNNIDTNPGERQEIIEI